MEKESDRPSYKERAGTKIDHRFAEKIYGRGTRGRLVHGLLDPRNGVYQCGGELRNFVYWRERLVSLDVFIWEQIKDRVSRLEFVDHDKNVCYAVSVEVASANGRTYNAGIGTRFGIPLDLFEKSA